METILRSFIKQRKQFLHANDQLHEGVGLSTKNIRSHRDHQAYGLVIEDEKDVLVGGYRKSPVFAGYHTFARAGHIERYMEGIIFRIHETKKDDQFWLLQICLETLSTYIHLKMEMEELVA